MSDKAAFVSRALICIQRYQETSSSPAPTVPPRQIINFHIQYMLPQIAEANQDEVGAPGKINRQGHSKRLLIYYFCLNILLVYQLAMLTNLIEELGNVSKCIDIVSNSISDLPFSLSGLRNLLEVVVAGT